MKALFETHWKHVDEGSPKILFHSILVVENIVYLALICFVLGLLNRDELKLRILLLFGTSFYLLYYFKVGDEPLWDAIWTSAAIGVTNVVMIAIIMRERSLVGLSEFQRDLYGYFPTMLPGQFRRILKLSTVVRPEGGEVLILENRNLTKLFLIVDGEVEIDREGKKATIGAGHFLGELSFILGNKANATAVSKINSRLLCWEVNELRILLQRFPRTSNALVALFNMDVARKLSTSWPDR